jgi:hypothetical protein
LELCVEDGVPHFVWMKFQDFCGSKNGGSRQWLLGKIGEVYYLDSVTEYSPEFINA